MAEVKNHNPPISILVCVVDVHGISNYDTHGQGRLHARHSFCDPNYDRARSEVEGKVHRQHICLFFIFYDTFLLIYIRDGKSVKYSTVEYFSKKK